MELTILDQLLVSWSKSRGTAYGDARAGHTQGEISAACQEARRAGEI
jgi:hypothetical protein